ncbi:MAG: hypothetical protein GX584_11080 [Clostridiaceae bacterium]|nr:hypothetical protein [Clostridiaceae bacterium]
MTKKTHKSNTSKSKTNAKPKKQISKVEYAFGKIILVLLFISVIALAIYLLLDWSLTLANKRINNSDASVDKLISSIRTNDYETAVTLYDKIKTEQNLTDDAINKISSEINSKFNSFFDKDFEYDSNEASIIRHFSMFITEEKVNNVVNQLYNTFRTTTLSYENYQNTINHINDLLKDENFENIINLHKDNAEIIRTSREMYNKAKTFEQENDYLNAYESYLGVSEKDAFYYSVAQEDAFNLKGKIKNNILSTARTFEEENDIENAYYTMQSVPDIISDDNEIIEYKKYINDLYQKQNYTEYKGTVYNMFFHSLALYPEIAFSSSRGEELFNIMTTRYEFIRCLNELYEHDFILINPSDLYDIYTQDNTEYLKIKDSLLLPEGKKPLILSFDNLSFVHASVGFCKKLVIDESGNLASIVTINGTDTLTYDGEHVLILHDFVKEHPDFSYNNAMAVLGMSGYESLFGYNTADLNSPDVQSELDKAKQVADKLKNMGYIFANHSYYHYSNSSDIPSSYTDLEWLKYDTGLWKERIEPILGDTNIYITPGGKNYSVTKYVDGDKSDPCYNYLVSEGYQIILSVGRGQFYTNNIIGVSNPRFFFETSLFMDRYNIDGKSFYKEDVKLIDVFGFEYKDIIDPIRESYHNSY